MNHKTYNCTNVKPIELKNYLVKLKQLLYVVATDANCGVNISKLSAAIGVSRATVLNYLNYLKNAWAAAFAPIVNVVAPYVETFINILASALNAIGRFMAALTGKGFAVQAKSVWTDYAASLDKAGSSAGG